MMKKQHDKPTKQNIQNAVYNRTNMVAYSHLWWHDLQQR